MPSARIALSIAVAASVLACTGCGGGGEGSSATRTPAPATGHVVRLSADPSGAIRFTQSRIEAKAGKVTLEMANPSEVPHSIAVEGNGVDADSTQRQVGKGQTASVTATLAPGRYTFYCPVDHHKDQGMKGTLIVR